jgi:hypothetical protein
MKKSLHGMMEGWFASRKGHIPFYKLTFEDGQVLVGHTGDVQFLIEAANKYLGEIDVNRTAYISFDQMFGYSLGVWMGRFLEEGFSMSMLRELRQELGEIRFFHVLNPAIPSRGKPLPHWDHVADMEHFNDPSVTAAYAFSQQMTLDGFTGLKRCKMKSCKRFFIGRPDSKWCSTACGSRYRVSQMRKRNKS